VSSFYLVCSFGIILLFSRLVQPYYDWCIVYSEMNMKSVIGYMCVDMLVADISNA
jgi:hypothetical protein